MDSLSTPQVAARRATEPARTDGCTDLVIVVLNELACAGTLKMTFSGADYTGAMPVAIAE
jgi:hypothetical protein